MAPLATQRFVCGSWRRRTTPVAVIEIEFHVLVELFEEKGSLEAHLGYAAGKAGDAEASRVVGVLDVIDAPSNVDALAVVGGLD